MADALLSLVQQQSNFLGSNDMHNSFMLFLSDDWKEVDLHVSSVESALTLYN